jgi:hypothetical protein
MYCRRSARVGVAVEGIESFKSLRSKRVNGARNHLNEAKLEVEAGMTVTRQNWSEWLRNELWGALFIDQKAPNGPCSNRQAHAPSRRWSRKVVGLLSERTGSQKVI